MLGACIPSWSKLNCFLIGFIFDFSLSCTGKGNGNPLQCSCLENPRDRGAWWAAIYGVTQSWTWLKQLSSSRMLIIVSLKAKYVWIYENISKHIVIIKWNIPLFLHFQPFSTSSYDLYDTWLEAFLHLCGNPLEVGCTPHAQNLF